MTAEPNRYGPADVAVGDYVWGVGVSDPRPVIGVGPRSVTVGIYSHAGVWLTTQSLRWADIDGVISTLPDVPHDTARAFAAAADRVRHAHLDSEQREALAALLLIAGSFTLPTPVAACVVNAVTALTRTRQEPPGS